MISGLIKKLGANPAARALARKMGISGSVVAKLKEMSYPSKSKARRLKDIESRIEDLNFKLDLLMDYYLDVSKAHPAKGKRLEMQQRMFRLLCQFKEICERHGIKYWLEYGTLLGAKRHGGFIPWDTDSDMGMMFDDAVKYGEIFKAELPSDISFVIRNNEHAQLIGDGVYCDIYCYDDLSDRIKMRIYTFLFPKDMLSIPKEVMFPLSSIDFNGVSFSAPANVDMYLRARYGNYHVLPKHAHPYEHPEWDDRTIFYPDEKV